MTRRTGLFFGAVVLAAALGSMWRFAVGTSSDLGVVILEVQGAVTLGADGAAQGVPAAAPVPGSAVPVGSRIRTGEDGRAVLGIGGQSRVTVAPRSDLVIQGVAKDGVDLRLEGGRLQATVFPEDGALRVAAREQRLLALSADFEVGVVGDLVQVRTDRGEVSVSGADVEHLAAGTEASFVDRRGTIGPVPTELLLDVPWPSGAPTRDATARVIGVTAPGARLRIRGRFPGEVAVVAGADGRFEATVPLVEGPNDVEVLAFDALGRERRVDGVVANRDTTGPAFNGGAVYVR
jgi:hypothetical protein